MSLHAEYLLERTSDLIIEDEFGFATYRWLPDATVYIIDIYVVPEMRKQGYASQLADRVVKHAREYGCVEMIGSVVPSTKGSTTSMKVLLGYGMTLKSAGQDFIIFTKSIKDI